MGEILTIGQFFDVENEVEKKSDEILASDKFKDLGKEIVSAANDADLPDGFSDGLVNLLIENLNKLLEIEIVGDVLGAAWSKHQALQEYRDLEKYPPGEVSLVPMVSHVIESTHKPSIEVIMFEESVGSIELQVDTSFKIDGAILEIEEAKITKVNLSSIEGTGKFSTLGIPLLEKTREMKLPGVIELEKPIEIRSLLDVEQPEPDGEDEPEPEAAAGSSG